MAAMDFASFDGTALEAATYDSSSEKDPLTVYSAVGERLSSKAKSRPLRSQRSVAEILKAAKSFREDGHGEKLLSNAAGVEDVTLTPELEDAIFNSDFSAASLEEILESLGGLQGLGELVAKVVEAVLGAKLPPMTVRYSHMGLRATIVHGGQSSSATLGSVVTNLFTGFCRKKERSSVDIIKDCTGYIKPASLTLVLGRPGSGKSSFLKLLSAQLKAKKGMEILGHIDYNGANISDIGPSFRSSVRYVTQRDIHAPTLTVSETFTFAHYCLNGKKLNNVKGVESYQPALKGERRQKAIELLDVLLQKRPQMMLKVLGLEKCKDTIVGNAMLRGVSGGERKRVTTGEVLVGRNRALFMDEISTGLDSAATFDIVKSLKGAAQQFGVTFVIALLQPPPEVFELFDEVILLHEGHVAYHGPTSTVVPYFASIGYAPPPHKDVADFLVEVFSPTAVHFVTPEFRDKRLQLPRSGEEFAALWQDSAQFKEMEEFVEAQWVGESPEWLTSQKEFEMGWWDNFLVVLARQMKLTIRNKVFIFMRIFMVLFGGILYGTVFRDADKAQPNIIIGALFASLMFVSMGQASQIATFTEMRGVFYKQRAMNMMRSSNYVFSVSLAQVPFSFLEALVFGNILYWLVGLAATWYNYLFFMLLLTLTNLAFTQYFFFISCLMPNLTSMQPVTFVSILLFVLFAGFTITKTLIPDGWIWMYYISPVQWGITSLALNEYKTDALQTCVYNDRDYCALFNQKAGDFFLQVLGFPTDYYLQWVGVLYLAGFFVLFSIFASVLLEKVQHAEPVSLSKPEDDKEPVLKPIASATSFHERMESIQQLTESTRPKSVAFQPAVLAFRDLWYTVKVPAGKNKTEELDLLKGISGYMLPGTMTALMGSSGAGKTTLMDVIAYRKNTGTVKGDILINGHPADNLTIRRTTGYCEQMDIHSPTTTVREALLFSAKLRQDAEVSNTAKQHAVDEAIDLLELEDIADLIVGGLSIEQQKRLTIGVELVANPSIIFLDEPTSGLDARAAKIIMRGVRKIANSGRTIICTIHQPSSDVFLLFDNLLLLKRGGETVYFGEIGENGRKLVSHLEGIPGTPAMRPGYNPATYMLEVIGAGVGRAQVTDYAAAWRSSLPASLLEEELQQEGVGLPSTRVEAIKYARKRAAAPGTQVAEIFLRFFRMHWRSPHYNFARLAFSIFLAIVFLSVYRGTDYGTYQGALSGVGMIFLSVLFVAMTMFNSVQPVIYEERAAYYRERAAQTYNALWWWIAIFTTEIPYIFGVNLVYCAIFFPSVGFTGVENFFMYWFVHSLYCWVMVSFAQLLIGLLPNVAFAAVFGALYSIILNLFAGFNPPTGDIPSYWRWFTTIVPSSYGLSGLLSVTLAYCSGQGGSEPGCQLICDESMVQSNACSAPALEIDGKMTYVYTLEQLMDISYDVTYDDRWTYIAGLLVILAIYGVLSVASFRFINWTVR